MSDNTQADDTASSKKRAGEPAWQSGEGVLETPLPERMQSVLGEFVGEGAVETLSELSDAIRRFTGGNSIAVNDLCHSDVETEHWGSVDGQRHYFQCFYDAVILAALTDRSVDIRTVSPSGTVIEAKAIGGQKLSVDPSDAVFSFGIAEDAGNGNASAPSVEDGYSAICPYVRAFPDREAYEKWAATIPAVTISMPLAGATELAGSLAAPET